MLLSYPYASIFQIISFIKELYSYLSEKSNFILKTNPVFPVIKDFTDAKELSSTIINEDTGFMLYLSSNIRRGLINSVTLIKVEATRSISLTFQDKNYS